MEFSFSCSRCRVAAVYYGNKTSQCLCVCVLVCVQVQCQKEEKRRGEEGGITFIFVSAFRQIYSAFHAAKALPEITIILWQTDRQMNG